MPQAHLTDIGVKHLKPPPKGQIDYWDDTFPGFGVRVSATVKTFVLMHGVPRRRKTIGRYPILSLSDARTEAKRILAEQTLGKRQPSALSFVAALDIYLEQHCKPRLRPRSYYDNKRLLNRHYLPRFRMKRLADIRPHDVSSIIDKLMLAETPSEALHAFIAARTFFRWAYDNHYIDLDVMRGIKPPPKNGSRERVLNDQEINIVWHAADKLGHPFGNIVSFCSLTGQRRSEIGLLQWSYINEQELTITLPAAITKNKRATTFPYGDQLATILSTIPRSGDYLFPQKRDKAAPFGGWNKGKDAIDKIIREIDLIPPVVQDWTLHDLRRTFSTNLALLGVPIHVIERLLNHVTGVISEQPQFYNRAKYMEEMRLAIGTWDKRLATISSLTAA